MYHYRTSFNIHTVVVGIYIHTYVEAHPTPRPMQQANKGNRLEYLPDFVYQTQDYSERHQVKSEMADTNTQIVRNM